MYVLTSSHRSYNVTCIEELPRPGFPKTCCTIQDIPLIRFGLHLVNVFTKYRHVSKLPEAQIYPFLLCGSVTHLHSLNLPQSANQPFATQYKEIFVKGIMRLFSEKRSKVCFYTLMLHSFFYVPEKPNERPNLNTNTILKPK